MGQYPVAGLVQDNAGNLYGTTYYGGASDAGAVFKVDPTGTETVLYSFGGPAGAYPLGGLVQDNAGNLYGTTSLWFAISPDGGASAPGVVFKLDLMGAESVLHTFAGYPTDGAYPYYAAPVQDKKGNLYGTTYAGGASNSGVVFKLTP
jgi:uncharacterized repeat protein (TIGR03803 family)